VTGAIIGFAVAPLSAQPGIPATVQSRLLSDLDDAVEELARRVSPSVVQVMVTGYGQLPDQGQAGSVIGQQHILGSGAIVDADGYVLTNAHLVDGAQRIQVVVHPPVAALTTERSLAAEGAQSLDAKIVGVSREVDLALLKVEAKGLHALPLADYDHVHQGELVFAFGSPEGLRNSVTMGVVSAVARQPSPDSPSVYIQTDAPINPGNSGGPLVNVRGEIVGLNTFIVSQSGGSQGLGFAIPSAILSQAYPQLRNDGHLHHGYLGFEAQAINPVLAGVFGLPTTIGVVISDVVPDGPADRAGVAALDVVQSIDGKMIDTMPMLALELNRRKPGDVVKLGILRGPNRVSLTVGVIDRPHAAERLADLVNPAANTVPRLGIVGLDVTDLIRPLLPKLRISSGVIVAGQEPYALDHNIPLVTGDVIHALNGFTVGSVDGLQVIIDGVKPSSGIVLQIERDGRLMFVTFQLD
jgi:serine protease Do